MPTDLILQNLISPITLAFLLGILATLVKSDLEFPEPVLKLLSIFLLFSIGLQGGRELAKASLADFAGPLGAAVALILLLPAFAFLIARRLLKFSIPDATGVAALYGSVSSVTFLAALDYARARGTPAEGFVTALVALMEWGILVALFIGRLSMRGAAPAGAQGSGHIVMETLRGRGSILLMGGIVIGWAIGEKNFQSVSPFFVDLFRGVLVLFILEMGMTAARRLREFAKVGVAMIGFGVIVPLLNGAIGSLLGTLAGLSTGGAFVLGAVAASASYIDAPAAVRASMPEANPSIYLTSSLGVTFPFNLTIGLPLVYEMATIWRAVL
jgi:hypothetical protein